MGLLDKFKKRKNICILLGILIILMIAILPIKENIDSIMISKEIKLTDAEKNEVNKEELVKDIISYKKTGEYVYAQGIHYTSEDAKHMTIPIYDGTQYGKGYSANSNTGEFIVSGRCVYKAERSVLVLRYIIYIIIIVLVVVEVVLVIATVIKYKHMKLNKNL